ncbi:MAG: hypothetical protein HY000_30855 [Planctomycetes bacterium]|nr:hypothetical protein [Planctomycetota bacterium]
MRQNVPRDLEAICLKCLEKEPQRRYPTAAALAEDLRRYLGSEPVQARAALLWERTAKWIRRRPSLAALIAVVALSIVGWCGVSLWNEYRFQGKEAGLLSAATARADGLVEAQRNQTAGAVQLQRGLAYASNIRQAAEYWQTGQLDRLSEFLTNPQPFPAGDDDLRGFEWHYLRRLAQGERFCRRDLVGRAENLALSPDGAVCAIPSLEGTINLWDMTTGQVRHTLQGTLPVHRVALSPDGLVLASWASAPGSNRGELKLWEVASGAQISSLEDPGGSVGWIGFSSDGRLLVTVGVEPGPTRRVGKLWDVGSRRLIGELLDSQSEWSQHQWGAISPDSETVALACANGNSYACASEILLWDLASRNLKGRLSGHKRWINVVAFAPDGLTLASASNDKTVKLWDMSTMQLRATIPHVAEVDALAFASDGRTLATGCYVEEARSVPATIELWNSAGRAIGSLGSPGTDVLSLAFVPDGRTLVAGCGRHELRVWDVDQRLESVYLPGHSVEAWSVAFSPNGTTLASGSDDHTIKLWDLRTGRGQRTLSGHAGTVMSLAYSPDGLTLATGSYDRTVKLWDPITGQERVTLAVSEMGSVRTVAFSPNGTILATGSDDRKVRIWDAGDGKLMRVLEGHTDRIHAVVFAPDGRTLASADEDKMIQLWRVATGERISTLWDTEEVWGLAFSPDGTLLATGNRDGIVKLWRMDSDKEPAILHGHTQKLRSVCFSPDGKTLASCGMDKTVRLWHVGTGHELLCLKGQNHTINSVTFSPDGKSLAAAIHDGAVKLWTISAKIRPED